jgi:hypothetical protein
MYNVQCIMCTVYVYIYIYIYICMYLRIYIYIHMYNIYIIYIHTYIHIYVFYMYTVYIHVYNGAGICIVRILVVGWSGVGGVGKSIQKRGKLPSSLCVYGEFVGYHGI